LTRILDLYGPALAALRGSDLIDAIRAAEGRTLLAEVVAPAPSFLGERRPSNLELVAAFGADLVCLNMFDPYTEPPIEGASDLAGASLALGRLVGLNLEPAVDGVPENLRATDAIVKAVDASGAAFAIVTANPGRGTGTRDLAAAVATVRKIAPELVCVAGRMHASGVDEPFDIHAVDPLIDAGAHGVIVPVPGTVPALREETAASMVARAHHAGALAMSTIGTSQEGADVETMRILALAAKRIGADVHHIGDAGFNGVAPPENIYAYGVAIRGVRHTWARMAGGVRSR
jgi:hypothetical protein